MGGWVGLIETGFFCFVCFRGGKVNGGGRYYMAAGGACSSTNEKESESGARDEDGGVVGRPVAEGKRTITQA